MPNSTEDTSLGSSLDIKDYIDAATEAARGTRVVTIVLVVACVLVFIGFWNSFQWSWPNQRLVHAFNLEDPTIYGTLQLGEHPTMWPTELRARDIKDPLHLAQKLSDSTNPVSVYFNGKLSPEIRRRLEEGVSNRVINDELQGALAAALDGLLSSPSSLYDEKVFKGAVKLSGPTEALILHQSTDEDELKRLNRLLLEDAFPQDIARSQLRTSLVEYRKQMMQSGVRAYIENVRFVKTPFFGIAFDVNDLGLIGGIGFIIILLLLRHSLSREVKSLNKSFTEALRAAPQQFHHFYHVLAMKMVFTLPEMVGEVRNKWLALSVKLVCFMPSLVFLMAVTYDWVSVLRLGLFALRSVWLQLTVECILMACIGYLSYRCYVKLRDIDEVWDKYWERIERERSRLVVLDEELIGEFGTDTLASNALRCWREGRPYGADTP